MNPILIQNVFDISVLLGIESIDYPGDTQFSKDEFMSIKNGEICNLSKLSMSAHSGTHIDTPLHFVPNGKSIDEFQVNDFILQAQVIEILDKNSIQPEEIRKVNITNGEALLFKTDNSYSGRCASGKFSKKYVYLSPEAADLCIQKKIKLVGIDYISIEKYEDTSFPVHNKLLTNDILILEGINLQKVPIGKYSLICLPLKLKSSEASPVRAILMN